MVAKDKLMVKYKVEFIDTVLSTEEYLEKRRDLRKKHFNCRHCFIPNQVNLPEKIIKVIAGGGRKPVYWQNKYVHDKGEMYYLKFTRLSVLLDIHSNVPYATIFIQRKAEGSFRYSILKQLITIRELKTFIEDLYTAEQVYVLMDEWAEYKLADNKIGFKKWRKTRKY